jgi:hypothetical protein
MVGKNILVKFVSTSFGSWVDQRKKIQKKSIVRSAFIRGKKYRKTVWIQLTTF